MNKYSVPRIAFINKMDRTGADFYGAVEDIKTKLNGNPHPIYLPIGSEGTVTGVDDIGTIHVKWDCGSSLGVVYPEDKCEIIY